MSCTRFILLTFCSLCLAPSAQTQNEQEEQLERYARALAHNYRRALDLSEPQVEKLISIHREKISELIALLTPDQRTRLDRHAKQVTAWSLRRRHAGSWRIVSLQQELDRLREQLTPSERTRIQKELENLDASMEAMISKTSRNEYGQLSPKLNELEQAFFAESARHIGSGVRETWKDVGNRVISSRAERLRQMRERREQRGGGENQDSHGSGGDRSQSSGRSSTVDRILSELGLGTEETSIVRPMIEQIREAVRTRRRERENLRRKIRQLVATKSDESTLRKELTHYSKQTSQLDTGLESARQALREIVTPSQEAVLVARGIL